MGGFNPQVVPGKRSNRPAAARSKTLVEYVLLKALEGFSGHGLGRGFLEVTAQNEPAVRLYRQVGFRARKTVYKAVEVAEPWPVAGVR